MATNLTTQVRNIAAVTTAVATGACQKITVDVRGEILGHNQHDGGPAVSSHRRRASRVVVRKQLGGQAEVKGVAGNVKDLTTATSFNPVYQVRGIESLRCRHGTETKTVLSKRRIEGARRSST
jgi:hypothetical protein